MNSGLRPGLTPTGLALKQLALLLIINEKVSYDERGKESRVALELDDLDCSDGHTLLVEFDFRGDEVSVADTSSVLVRRLLALLQQCTLQSDRRTGR
jgi:hypothetical protein